MLKLGATVYRKRKRLSRWEIYRTLNGVVVSAGRTYRYYGNLTNDRLLSIEDTPEREVIRKVLHK
jgi:hypothetical protein|tara:strand:+ start:141 stop:335 length:195 start_codon:yes stop_codon:yes gene_type:complete